MSLLQTHGLSVAYGPIRAVDNVGIEVRAGQMVGLIGRNGAGKSSLLQAICGLLKPAGGTIVFDGRRVDGLPANKVLETGIAYVPEGRRVFADMTVAENLRIGGFRHLAGGGKGDVAARQLDKVFSFFPLLRERSSQAAGTLSGGQQQMLAIGRALMSDPKVLLLDEPSMGLAPVAFQALFDRIKELHASGLTILIVEQKAYITLRLVDYAYVINQGRIALAGTGPELLASAEIQATYLGGGAAPAPARAPVAPPPHDAAGPAVVDLAERRIEIRTEATTAAVSAETRLRAAHLAQRPPTPTPAAPTLPSAPRPRGADAGLSTSREGAMRRRHRLTSN